MVPPSKATGKMVKDVASVVLNTFFNVWKHTQGRGDSQPLTGDLLILEVSGAIYQRIYGVCSRTQVMCCCSCGGGSYQQYTNLCCSVYCSTICAPIIDQIIESTRATYWYFVSGSVIHGPESGPIHLWKFHCQDKKTPQLIVLKLMYRRSRTVP